MTDIVVVVGGQFGSEGKGAVAAHLSRSFTERDLAIRVAGPNAGHTAYDAQGREWKLRALPVAAVVNEVCQLHIAAGSEIDPTVLWDEIQAAEAAGHRIHGRLTIHPSATMLGPEHIKLEQAKDLSGRIGSTAKGIGAARADRIWRTAGTAEQAYGADSDVLSLAGPLELDDLDTVLIEGTQGYGLGLHTRQYPQVTSSDCRAIDFLAMAGISPWAIGVDSLQIFIATRVYPIRVAGNSGPLEGETTWEALGLPEERTTVTNKVRRVGEFDSALLREAIQANGGGRWHGSVTIALTMLDQKFPDLRDITDVHALMNHAEARRFIDELELEFETVISLVGTGPNTMVTR